MGYTHYFRQSQDCGPRIWKRICDQFALLLQHLPETSQSSGASYPDTVLMVRREEDDAGPVLIDGENIIFNGWADMGYETMVVSRQNDGFQFCKTERKPYDLVVQGLLMIMEHHAPKVWKITSDGDLADWVVAWRWVRETLGPDYKMPKAIIAEAEDPESYIRKEIRKYEAEVAAGTATEGVPGRLERFRAIVTTQETMLVMVRMSEASGQTGLEPALTHAQSGGGDAPALGGDKAE